MKWTIAFVVLAVVAALAYADKDTDYYPTGVSNPNVERKMYWKKAINVLQDISQFDKLYVQYHTCAMTPVTTGDRDGPDGHDEHWYMGLTPRVGANVGYSLYGILKGEDDEGCIEHTFINSFITTTGAAQFGQALALKGDYLTSYTFEVEGMEDNRERKLEDASDAESAYKISSACYLGEDGSNGDDQQQDDHDATYKHGEKYAQGSTSYSLACQNLMFVQAEFQGAYCDGLDQYSAIDLLDDFNEDIKKVNCAVIYDSSYDAKYYYEDNNAGNEGGQDQDQTVELQYAVDLLQVSRACSIRAYPNECPDPHGLVAKYANALENTRASSADTSVSKFLRRFGYAGLMALGFILVLISCGMDGWRISNSKGMESEKATTARTIPVIRQLSSASQQVVKGVKENTKSAVQRIRSYAEEEAFLKESIEVGNHESIKPSDILLDAGNEEAANEEIANAVLASVAPEKVSKASAKVPLETSAMSLAPVSAEMGKTVEEKPKKIYKRPRMARISRVLFGRSAKKAKKSCM